MERVKTAILPHTAEGQLEQMAEASVQQQGMGLISYAVLAKAFGLRFAGHAKNAAKTYSLFGETFLAVNDVQQLLEEQNR